ncbi:hypothetical protein PCASD_15318 [Puccinia coronata f. sp. avenae]|uniref:Uncharacterized protein n=1 Tax=Puccinia coronata f. sp. avenae TaxID=200324 RepID=A0A2N5UB83_9BASI|nr:hypothetical protein PCASD_15318 [Puccinia coronata f. sp. avenae]
MFPNDGTFTPNFDTSNFQAPGCQFYSVQSNNHPFPPPAPENYHLANPHGHSLQHYSGTIHPGLIPVPPPGIPSTIPRGNNQISVIQDASSAISRPNASLFPNAALDQDGSLERNDFIEQNGSLATNGSLRIGPHSSHQHVSMNQTPNQLEADLLAEINSFSAPPPGDHRGQGRGRGRGSRGGRGSQGGRGSRGGRGRGGITNARSVEGHSSAAPATEGGSANQNRQEGTIPTFQSVEDVPDDDAEDNAEENERLNAANLLGKPNRMKLEPNIVEEICQLPLDDLRRRAAKYAHYQRLTAEDRHCLTKAYYAYQREVYLLICTRRLQPNPALDHLGLLARSRPSTNYNLYCKYDEVASETYHNETIHINVRQKLCGQLWDALDSETHERWKDPNFVDAQASAAAQRAPATAPGADASSKPPRKSKFDLNPWAREMKRDLRNLSTTANLEGFLVLVSRDPNSNSIVTGGSLLGEQFIDMMSKKQPNPWRSFFSYVSGHAALADITGTTPSALLTRKKRDRVFKDPLERAYDKGSRPSNLNAARNLLANAWSVATHGKGRQGWPGTSTEEALKKARVELKVKENHLLITPNSFCCRVSDMDELQMVHALVAFGEGWAQLIGPPAPEIDVGRSISIGGGGAVGNSTASGENETTCVARDENLTGPQSENAGASNGAVQAGQRRKHGTKRVVGRTRLQTGNLSRRKTHSKQKKNMNTAHLQDAGAPRKRRRLVICDSDSG